MSQQGPIIVVSGGVSTALTDALTDAKLFPVIETDWPEATRAVEESQPAAILVSGDADLRFAALAAQVGRLSPYVPLIVIDPQTSLPANALPLAPGDGGLERLRARLRAALRIGALHAAVLRRIGDDAAALRALTETDPIHDATVLLIGRGARFPALSVALGERMGVVGAFSIEAAAKHLNSRDLDGIVLGEGFSPRVVDAFLTVLAEDARFRPLPVVLSGGNGNIAGGLPNLEIIFGAPDRIASNSLPLIRQHAFAARLTRTLRSIEAGGLLDARTGLLTPEAFARDFAKAISQATSGGGGLSIARFSFHGGERARLDGARIISRLMRPMDFGALERDGSIVVAFSDADLRSAHMIARRLCSVMKHTLHGPGERQVEPHVSAATLLPSDSPSSILARLKGEARRAAS
jgi:hypothetical protein